MKTQYDQNIMRDLLCVDANSLEAANRKLERIVTNPGDWNCTETECDVTHGSGLTRYWFTTR